MVFYVEIIVLFPYPFRKISNAMYSTLSFLRKGREIFLRDQWCFPSLSKNIQSLICHIKFFKKGKVKGNISFSLVEKLIILNTKGRLWQLYLVIAYLMLQNHFKTQNFTLEVLHLLLLNECLENMTTENIFTERVFHLGNG